MSRVQAGPGGDDLRRAREDELERLSEQKIPGEQAASEPEKSCGCVNRRACDRFTRQGGKGLMIQWGKSKQPVESIPVRFVLLIAVLVLAAIAFARFVLPKFL